LIAVSHPKSKLVDHDRQKGQDPERPCAPSTAAGPFLYLADAIWQMRLAASSR